MTDKFQNKYRIPSARAQWWDYGNAAAYFITICTHNREHYSGKIENGIMILNDTGKMAYEVWLKTTEIRCDMNLIFEEFVVMLNHFHAIIIIGENKYNNGHVRIGGLSVRDDGLSVGSQCIASLHQSPPPQTPTPQTDTTNTNAMHSVSMNKFAPQSKNLASIVRGFKSSVTTRAKKSGHGNFAWQTRFHDHIIRDQKSFDNISQYII